MKKFHAMVVVEAHGHLNSPEDRKNLDKVVETIKKEEGWEIALRHEGSNSFAATTQIDSISEVEGQKMISTKISVLMDAEPLSKHWAGCVSVGDTRAFKFGYESCTQQ